jgi:hypothetical protein
MNRLASLFRRAKPSHVYTGIALVLLTAFYTYRLGSLPDGLSRTEFFSSSDPVGWHGIYDDPFYLPLKLLRSALFFMQPDHGQLLTRLANVPFGILAIVCFYIVVRWWYGLRIANLSTILFAASAWSLHVTRFAGFETLYFAALPTLLLCHIALQRYKGNPFVAAATLGAWLCMLYVPGLIWFVVVSACIQRKYLVEAFQEMSVRLRLASAAFAIVMLPLLLRHFIRPGALLTWIGLPETWGTPLHIAKEIVAVPVHLFIRGPQYPEIWLGKAPILDIFCLALAIVGLYFFARRYDASRSRLLIGVLIFGILLIGLEGAVSISLLIPLLFVFAATGLAYLLKEWLKVFPSNPVPRTLGVGLIIVAVAMSVTYNTRAYFVAWPHAPATEATFRYHR